jgi:hypothetical protein
MFNEYQNNTTTNYQKKKKNDTNTKIKAQTQQCNKDSNGSNQRKFSEASCNILNYFHEINT